LRIGAPAAKRGPMQLHSSRGQDRRQTAAKPAQQGSALAHHALEFQLGAARCL